MKYLKYALFLIIGLILIFLLFGLLKPTVSYSHEITVNKPIKEAWAVQQDQSKLPQWIEGVKSIELISGEHSQPGSKYKVIINPGEDQPDFEMTETIVSIKEFENMHVTFDSDMMLFDHKVTYSGSDGNVKIKTDSKVNGKGIMMRSMFAIMSTFGNTFHKQEVKNAEALKKLIEENTTDYYPTPVVTEEVEKVEGN